MKTMNFVQAVRRSKFSKRRLTTIETWEFHLTVSNMLNSFGIPFEYDIRDSFLIDEEYADDFFYIIRSVVETHLGIEYGDDLDELLDFFSNLQN